MINVNKISVSSESTHKLGILKSRTGLTPNILCRMGFCLSLNEPGMPNNEQYIEDGMEFNRYTLTGQFDTLFVSLLKERCLQDKIYSEENLSEYFLAHINRGIELLYVRLKSLKDLSNLLALE
jgi:DNA sulfur modification protein DndE